MIGAEPLWHRRTRGRSSSTIMSKYSRARNRRRRSSRLYGLGSPSAAPGGRARDALCARTRRGCRPGRDAAIPVALWCAAVCRQCCFVISTAGVILGLVIKGSPTASISHASTNESSPNRWGALQSARCRSRPNHEGGYRRCQRCGSWSNLQEHSRTADPHPCQAPQVPAMLSRTHKRLQLRLRPIASLSRSQVSLSLAGPQSPPFAGNIKDL